jgi:membrane protein implicated in regulation of membrane protease activity
MPIEREFVLLTADGRRAPVWLRIWLAVAALAAGAVLFWFGLLLALAVLLATVVVLLPIWAWKSFRANRRPGRPATIEGDYRIITTTTAEGREEAQARNRS